MANVHLLQGLSPKKFSDMLCINFKSLAQQQQPSKFFTLYKTFCENANIEFSEFEPLAVSILQISKDAVQKCKSASQISEELLSFGMNENQVSIFMKEWEKVYPTLVQNIVADVIAVNPLVDMEWKFGVSSASNQLNTIGNVFLQIKLEMDQGNGRRKSVCFELQLSEFYAFLHEMERARASLDYLA